MNQKRAKQLRKLSKQHAGSDDRILIVHKKTGQVINKPGTARDVYLKAKRNYKS